MTASHGLDTTSGVPQIAIHSHLSAALEKLRAVLETSGSIQDASPANLVNLASEMLISLMLQHQQAAERPPVPGWPVTNDSKYTTDGEYLVNRATGQRVPHDMPVFTMLAKDPYTVATLTYYAAHINDPAHQTAVGRLIDRMIAWQRENTKRMKLEPDTAI